jgi:hypothetical protein
MKKKDSRPLLWHIYHTILAIELAIIVAIELTELILTHF